MATWRSTDGGERERVRGRITLPSVAVDLFAGGLASLGWLDTAAADRLGVAWRLLFWNPWWVIGVLGYCGSAWLSRYASAERDRQTHSLAE